MTLSLKHGIKFEQDIDETAHTPPEPEPSAKHSQSKLAEQGAARALHVGGWH